MCPVPTVGSSTSEASPGRAQLAPRSGTAPTPSEGLSGEPSTGQQSRRISEAIRNAGGPTFTPTKTEPGSGSTQTSRQLSGPSKPSSKPWRAPRNVREFAAQASLVGTKILNGEIDLETARAYSSVARTVAQSVSSETVRARMLKQAPDLDFDNVEGDDGEE